MKYILWEFQGLRVPMMADGEELYCTSKAIRSALGGIPELDFSRMANRYKSELSNLSAANCHAKEFLMAHKSEFSIIRVRGDMRLWNEDDVLTFAFHSRSAGAVEVRKQFRVFMKEHATKQVISREEFDALNEKYEQAVEMNNKLATRLDNLDKLVRPRSVVKLSLVS